MIGKVSGHRQLKQRGFSLVELFIAITISLVLIIGLLQVFLNTKRNSNLVNDSSALQENLRFANVYLTQLIRLAGYRAPPTSGSAFSDTSVVFASATPYVSGTNGAGLNGSDTLVIRYQGSGNGAGVPDGLITDCLNSAADSITLVTNTLSLTANAELQCQALNANAAIPNNTQILIAGVENFQVLYGEDLNGDNTPDRYVPADYPFLAWTDVVSVRISLLFKSDNPSRPITSAQTFNLLGVAYTSPVDNFLRTQATYTILLRNMMVNPR